MVANPQESSSAFLFARAWMQWFGGLVIVVLALGLVIEPGAVARQLYGADAGATNMIEGTRLRARHALIVYTGLLGLGIVALVLAGAGPFDALVHGMSAVSTGGFSTQGDSIAGLQSYPVQVGISLLTLCGAISLSAYPRSLRKGWRRLFGDLQVRMLIIACLLVSVILWLVMTFVDGYAAAESLRLAPLLALSAQTTSGFEAAPVSELGDASKLVLISSMFVGGDMGSTAGGIKIVRLLLVLQLGRFLFQRTLVSRHAVLDVDTTGWFDPRDAYPILALIFLFLLVTGVSWFLFLVLGYAPLDSLFEVVSAIGTVGLSSGVTSADLHTGAKIVLCVDMLMGRLEIVAILLMIYPGTWFGKRSL